MYLNKIKENVKGVFAKQKMKIAKAVCIFGILLFSTPMTVGAVAEVTAPIKSLQTLVTSIVSAVGAIVLVWGIFDFATAYQQHDSSQQTQSLRKIVAGLLMLAVTPIVTLLT